MKRYITNLIWRLIKPTVIAEAGKVASATVKANLAAVQALDSRFKESSRIIILAHTENGDRIKIVKTRPQIPLRELQEMSRELEERYGAAIGYNDMPYNYL